MSNGVMQCKQCGKLFMSYGTAMCPDCTKDMDRYFDQVKSYIYDHPQANVTEISSATGVDSAVVLDLLKQGRLSIGGRDEMLNCEGCGKSIQSGQYCEACLKNLEDALSGAVQKIEKKPTIGKMHLKVDEDYRS